jgi:uncharacterized protein (TIGR02246 family)
MSRSLIVVLMLLVGPALPATAQKADSVSEQALRHSIETICRQWEAAIAKQDPTAVAALFTADGTFVTPAGVLPDRQAIKTFYEGSSSRAGTTKSSSWIKRTWPATPRGRLANIVSPARAQTERSHEPAVGAWFLSMRATAGRSAC